MHTILEFHIKPHNKNTYSLEIVERGNSEPLIKSSFDYDLSYMTQFEINRLELDVKDPYGRLECLKAFGNKLHEKLFTPHVLKIWQDYKEKSDFLSLCVRLSPEVRGLEILPWETLYDGEEFISAGTKTGLFRLPLEVSIKDELPPIPSPIKMLALMSSPLDLKDNERLAIEREQEILLQAVNTPAGQGKLLVDFEDEAKIPVIESSLEGGYHIFHYSGHGIPPEDGGGLLLEDSEGKKRPVSVNDFLQTFQKGERDVRLAVISGCQTARTLHIGGFRDLARGIIRRNTAAVIAMQFSISDMGGLLLAESLYPRLMEGKTPDSALSASRRILLQSDDPHIQADALSPVLFASNNEPLKTKAEREVKIDLKPIDFTFYLPLPELSFGFYGRRREYRAVRDGLIYKNERAIIVYGIGGIGKTALISHTAARLKDHFKGVYAFDCSSRALAPETILLELQRYLEKQGIDLLKELIHQSFPPSELAGYLSQILNQIPLLIIFDNFETHLSHRKDTAIRSNVGLVSQKSQKVCSGNKPYNEEYTRHEISDENLRIFLSTLIKTTSRSARFLFTSRYLFDLEERRIGAIQELPLGDLSRPEVIGLMQKLPHLSSSSFNDMLGAFKIFGGHPYALVTLDRHCGHKPLEEALKDAEDVHTELREFIALEMSYSNLSEKSRELLDRLSAFRKPVGNDAVHWVMGKKVELTPDLIKKFMPEEMPEKLKGMDEKELLQFFQKYLPEKRKAENIDKHIRGLIGWGLLTPVEEDGQVKALSVHSLVRDFCKERQGDDLWRKRLKDAASYYTNSTKLLGEYDKSETAILSEMEAFELLVEAKEYEEAARIMISAHKFLARRGFGRYLESNYKRVVSKVNKGTQAVISGNIAFLLHERGYYKEAINEYERVKNIFLELSEKKHVAVAMHQIGIIHQDRGDYESALAEYEKSLKITEEIGDRASMAGTLGQIGRFFIENERYAVAFENFFTALTTFLELQSPDAKIVINDLKNLRSAWGAEKFDSAWKKKTAEDVPDWLKNDGKGNE